MCYSFAICPITIAAEASSASQFERECIAHVLINRSRSGRFAPTPEGCAVQRIQFSEWNDDPVDNKNLERVVNLPTTDPSIQAAARAWDSANGSPIDPTNGATHFIDKNLDPKPKWTIGAEISLTTDKFIFYKGVK